jgi:hypothetical protein
LLQVAAIASGVVLSGGVAFAATTGGHSSGAGTGSPAPVGLELNHHSSRHGASVSSVEGSSDSTEVSDTTEVTDTTDTTTVGETTTVAPGDGNDQGEDGNDQGEDGNDQGHETTTSVGETTTSIAAGTTTSVPCADQGQEGDGGNQGDAVRADDGSHHGDDCGDGNDQGDDGEHTPTSSVPGGDSQGNDN